MRNSLKFYLLGFSFIFSSSASWAQDSSRDSLTIYFKENPNKVIRYIKNPDQTISFVECDAQWSNGAGSKLTVKKCVPVLPGFENTYSMDELAADYAALQEKSFDGKVDNAIDYGSLVVPSVKGWAIGHLGVKICGRFAAWQASAGKLAHKGLTKGLKVTKGTINQRVKKYVRGNKIVADDANKFFLAYFPPNIGAGIGTAFGLFQDLPAKLVETIVKDLDEPVKLDRYARKISPKFLSKSGVIEASDLIKYDLLDLYTRNYQDYKDELTWALVLGEKRRLAACEPPPPPPPTPLQIAVEETKNLRDNVAPADTTRVSPRNIAGQLTNVADK